MNKPCCHLDLSVRSLKLVVLIVLAEWIVIILILVLVVPQIIRELLMSCGKRRFRLLLRHQAIRQGILLLKQLIQGIDIKGRSVVITPVG